MCITVEVEAEVPESLAVVQVRPVDLVAVAKVAQDAAKRKDATTFRRAIN